MKNPYDIEKDEVKFKFFESVTDSIDKWLLEKFPQFDCSLIDKIRKVELMTEDLKRMMKMYEQKIEEEKKTYLQAVTNQINEFINKEHPSLDKSLKMSVKTAENLIKKCNARVELMDKEHEEFKVYTSLCEDVYKMRDEFKEIKKFMENFKKKIQKAFDTKD
jgi:hypothetical protein